MSFGEISRSVPHPNHGFANNEESSISITDTIALSPKQYKIRFKQWGFWKNLSTQHASSLLELQESRQSLGKPSTFVRSGHKLEQNRIERTIRRSKARALARDESKRQTPEMSLSGHSMPNVTRKPLPTGIECRTPSPEPKESFVEADSVCDSPPHVRLPTRAGTLEAYNFKAAVDLQEQQDAYLHKLKICDIATRKLWITHFSWDTPAPSDSFTILGLSAFRLRNALLAVLEPAIIDKNRLCITYLQIYGGTFLDCSKLSLFSRQYVLPALEHHGSGGDTVALGRDADNFIQLGFRLLGLSDGTISLIESAGSMAQKPMLVDDVSSMQYENAIDPAVLHDFFDIDEPILPFASLGGCETAESPLVASGVSSPATTVFSASDYGMSPSARFSPATETDATIPEGSTSAAQSLANDPESDLLHGLDLYVSFYQSGDSAWAMTGLRNIATSEVFSTTRGKVITRLAWLCLFYIQREEGMVEDTEHCLMKAIRGSTYFRDDRGEEWHEVRHLFL